MSGVPFNPMRKTPPPPPYIDTVGLNPEDYISVEPGDGPLFLVSRDCLRVSPFIRRAFDKRVNITLPEIEILFFSPDEEMDEEELEVRSQQSDPLSPIDGLDMEQGDPSQEQAEAAEAEAEAAAISVAAGVEGAAAPLAQEPEPAAAEEQKEEDGPPKKKQETIFPEDPLYAIPKIPRPVEILTETLRNDDTILIRFPQLKSATLEVVVAYLYYKNRYEGRPNEPRENFSVPLNSALEIMKLAALLEC